MITAGSWELLLPSAFSLSLSLSLSLSPLLLFISLCPNPTLNSDARPSSLPRAFARPSETAQLYKRRDVYVYREREAVGVAVEALSSHAQTDRINCSLARSVFPWRLLIGP